MKYGLNDHVIAQINKQFEKFPFIEKAIIYGSRAKENYKEGSDIDLCLMGNDIDLSSIHKVEIALDDLYLPYTFDLSSYSLLENQDS